MRRGCLLLLMGLGAFAGCNSGSTDDPQGSGPQGISPQPQPNRRPARFQAPCTSSRCGAIPNALRSPRCTPVDEECTWSESTTVSYRPCPAAECGEAPSADVCAPGTTFKGNTCGSENEAACVWTTSCAPPRSTTPCPEPSGCGEMPLIGIVCGDGGTGQLLCMKFETRCDWQPSCE